MSQTPSIYALPFADLHAPTSQIPSLAKARTLLLQHRPLQALQLFLTVLNISCTLTGERNHILCFKTEPLRWAARFTCGADGGPIVWLHTDRSGARICLQEPHELQKVAEWVLKRQDELMKSSGTFRPPRRRSSEELLFKILAGSSNTRCLRFEEAVRAVQRACLLDACRELFVPLGVQPGIRAGRARVEFRNKFLREGEWFNWVEDGMVPEPVVWVESVGKWVLGLNGCGELTGGEMEDEDVGGHVKGPIHDQHAHLRTSVVLSGVYFNSTHQPGDDVRRFARVLQTCGLQAHIPTDNASLSEALVYNLACNHDRLALVQRVLSVRDERQIAFGKDSGLEQWLGKQVTDWYRPNAQLEKMEKMKAFRNPLRDEILLEHLQEIDLNTAEARKRKMLEIMAAAERKKMRCPILDEYLETSQLGRYLGEKSFFEQWAASKRRKYPPGFGYGDRDGIKEVEKRKRKFERDELVKKEVEHDLDDGEETESADSEDMDERGTES